jgi:hypothetical protein
MAASYSQHHGCELAATGGRLRKANTGIDLLARAATRAASSGRYAVDAHCRVMKHLGPLCWRVAL